jgi:hypothetical protein
MAKGAIGAEAPTTVNSSVRPREYLTVREVERLMAKLRRHYPELVSSLHQIV